MRVGKFLEHFQAATKAVATIQDPVLKATAVGRQLGYALYLVFDLLQWVHGSKAYQFKPETAKFISRSAARFWLYGLLFSLLSGVQKSLTIRRRLGAASRPRPTAEKEAERKVELQAILKEQHAVRRQILQDSVDFILPSTSLGYFNFNEGILGAAGFITAIMGGRTQWRAVNGGGAAKK